MVTNLKIYILKKMTINSNSVIHDIAREIYEMNKYSTFNVSQRNHIDMYFYFHKLSHKKRGKADILKLYKHDIAMIIQ